MTDGDSKPFSATSDHRKEAKYCDQCGSVLPSHKKRFCGQECKDRFVKQKYRMSRDIHADRSCAKCGKPIDAVAPKGTRYCSKKCRYAGRDHIKNSESKKAAHQKKIDAGEMISCVKCGETKPASEFRLAVKTCIQCDRDRARQYMRDRLSSDSAFYVRQKENSKRYRAENKDAARSGRIMSKVRCGKIKYTQHVKDWRKWKRAQHQDAHVRCMIEWRRKRTPEAREWCDRYFSVIGKPWLNPHLSEAEKYAVRYKIDIEFRLGEINRQTWRKETLKARDDGTINFWQLMRERKTCPYCGTAITKENAVADHMDSVKLGGANSQHNLTICCRSCNKRKAGRPYLEWVDMLPDNRKAAALRWYKRKHGYDPGQDSLAFEFAA